MLAPEAVKSLILSQEYERVARRQENSRAWRQARNASLRLRRPDLNSLKRQAGHEKLKDNADKEST